MISYVQGTQSNQILKNKSGMGDSRGWGEGEAES